MKIIPKTKELLVSNKAETMVEVTVAFLVLSIVMLLFAQGMNYANSAANYAVDRSRDSDLALQDLLNTVSGNGGNCVKVKESKRSLNEDDEVLKLMEYQRVSTDGGDHVFYYVYDANMG